MADLIIDNFQDGIAKSPYMGHALMRKIDIDSFKGSMRVKDKPLSAIPGVTSRTFTADASTDICTASASLVTQAGTDAGLNFQSAAVQFTTTGTLPAGLSLNTTYFLIYVSDTTFKVSTSWINSNGGTAIDITSTGTGVHTITAVTVGTIMNIVKDPRTGYYYAQDSNGRIWYTRGSTTAYLLDGNSLTGATGNGLCLFRVSDGSATYLFVFRNAKIDVINVYSNTELNAPTWTTDWQSLNSSAGSGNRHAAIVGQDNIIYYTDDRYVGSIQEKPGSVFAPGTAGTYTYSNQALTLPQNEMAYCITELQANILVGGLNFNKIYPWDRVSTSFTIPLNVPEKGVYQIVNTGNKVIILAGQKGNIYQTQGTYVTLYKEIPTYLMNNGNSLLSNPITWGGLATRTGAVVFGVGMTINTAASGLYVIYEDGRMVQDNSPYSGAGNVTAIYADTEIGFVFGSSGEFAYSSGIKPSLATYAAVYQSAFYKIGTKTHKAKYSEVEVQTARNQGGYIRVSYRTDISASFTTIATFSSTDISYNADAGLIDLENIQFQLEFDDDVEITKFSAIE